MNMHGRETHHYLKVGKMLISLDLCILNQSRNDGWFQDRHRQETVALLQEVVADRIREFYARRRAVRLHRGDKESKPKAEEPKMLQGNTVKIGYKFTKRPVTQRCLLTKSKFETIRLFPEKLHVYVCEYHPSTVLQTTAHLMHTIYKEPTPSTVGISDYFRSSACDPETRAVTSATSSVVKKRNKLKRIVKRQNNMKPANEEPHSTESGYDTPAGIPAGGQDMKEPGDETDARQVSHGRVRAVDEVTDEEAAGCCAVRSNDSGVFKQVQKEVIVKQKAVTSDRESVSAAVTSGVNCVLKPVKKRKRLKEMDQDMRNDATTYADESTGLDISDGEGRELVREKPVKRQRTENIADSENVILKTAQNGGPTSDLRTREQCLDGVGGGDQAVTRENDARNGEIANVDDEIVDLCKDEIFSDGDVDCLNDVTQDAESITKLSLLQLQRLVQKNKRYLKEIFIGKRPCKRHADYKQGGSARANLTYEAWYGPYSEEQVEGVMSELVKVYCNNHNKYLDYASKVLLPEALIKICMDVLHISLEEAQDVLQKTPLCSDATLLGSRYRGGVTNYSITQY